MGWGACSLAGPRSLVLFDSYYRGTTSGILAPKHYKKVQKPPPHLEVRAGDADPDARRLCSWMFTFKSSKKTNPFLSPPRPRTQKELAVARSLLCRREERKI